VTPEPKIVAAAIRLNGVIYAGKNHAQILADADKWWGLGWGGLKTGEQGFINSTWEFLTREEAANYAIFHGQIKKLKYSKTKLHSEELDL
jgi:hypothetical protein